MRKKLKVVIIGLSHHNGGLDDVRDIYKLVSYFVCKTSGSKDSFSQTNYILHEALGKDGSCRKRDVSSILNLISEAHLIKKVVKQARDYKDGYFLMKSESNQS